MQWFLDLVSNAYLIAGVSSWLLAQIIKTIIYLALNRTFRPERLVGDGGMPSGHSATVTGLSFMCLLRCGPGSVEFAITLLLAIIVCHDAMGVRRETGKQAMLLNDILEILGSEELLEVKLKELVGHTPLQVLVGIIIGLLNTLLIHFVILPL